MAGVKVIDSVKLKQRLVVGGLTIQELEQIRHAAGLNGLTEREYVVRAINDKMRAQGVDSILLAEIGDV